LAYGADFAIEKTADGFNYMAENLNLQLPKPALLGDHQYINAASAVAAALKLGVGQDAIAKGIASAYWPSRMEQIKKPYVPDGFEFWLDGAHNPAGAFVISNFVAENWADMPLYIIYGTTRGRNVAEFLQHFEAVAAEIVLTKIPAEPNSYEPEEMNYSAKGFASIKEAISYFATKPKGRILALGSLFMRGDV
jgi:dihydrofolate synthase/folylpolyglutamate synthase